MKIALVYSGQARTLDKTLTHHNRLIEHVKQHFNTVVVGCTDLYSTYPINEQRDKLGHKHYNETYEFNLTLLDDMNIDNVFLSDGSEFVKDTYDLSERERHFAAQYWKHAKAAMLAPDADIYVRCRWDIDYAWEAQEQLVHNINTLVNRDKYHLSMCTESLIIGQQYHSFKGNMFCDYAHTIITKKAQEFYNNNWLAVFKKEYNPVSFHFSQTWLSMLTSSEDNISISSAIYNNRGLYTIVRPDWYYHVE